LSAVIPTAGVITAEIEHSTNRQQHHTIVSSCALHQYC
jgi:hypothetical protein